MDQKKLKRKIKTILNDLGFPEAELSLVLTDDEALASLNEKYRGQKGPTNVLSFPQREGEFSQVNPFLLGDVVISVETALKEAQLAGRPLDWAVDRLIIHGLLHLAGFDHEAQGSDEAAMENKQRELMARLGWEE